MSALRAWLFVCVLAGCAVEGGDDRVAAGEQEDRQAVAHALGTDRPMAAAVDNKRETRAVKLLTDEEMVAALRSRLSRSTAGLQRTLRADGLVTLKFGERFGHVTLAKQMPDGSIRYVCVDNLKAAEAVVRSDPVRTGRGRKR